MKQLMSVLALIILVAGCRGPLSSPAAGSKSGVHKVVVSEVIHAGGYTYLKVLEKKKETWLAVPAMDAAKGDKISYSGGLEMKDFTSKELKRTFPSILFLEGVDTGSGSGSVTTAMDPMANMKSSGAVKTEKISVNIEPCQGCITIAKLYEGKTDYAGKSVKITGKVTKINAEIMGKNWIHIQDGTEFKGDFDLTVTSASKPAVGDMVTLEGKISLKKDFGYGYFYDIIMEDASLL